MNDQSTTTHEVDDLDTARQDVARAEARLSDSWRAAKVAGEKTLGRAMSLAKPLAVGAVIVGGVVLLVSAVSRRKRRSPWAYAPAGPPSLIKETARAAALALASAGARHLANRYLAAPVMAGGMSAEEKLLSKAGR